MSDLIENGRLSTEGLQFIGIGKVIYDDFDTDFNIPHLHFLTIEYDEGVFQAVNLEFQLFSLGETQEKAIANLVKMISSYIIGVCEKGRGFEELKDVALLNTMDAYWNKYREIEFELARDKKDLGHDIEQRFENTIKKMINDAIRELITEMSKEFVSEFEKIMSLWFSPMFQNAPNVSYQTYREAA